MGVKLVVFDMAGTTVKDHDNVHTALRRAFATEGIGVSRDEANGVMGYPKPIAIRDLLRQKLADPSKINSDYIDRIHRTFLAEMIRFYKTDPHVSGKEGVPETFRALRRHGIKVALDTGFDRSIATAILDRLGWVREGLIDASVTSDEVANGRPHPDLIFEAMRQTGIRDVKDVAKVGDTVSDLLQGKAAGCRWVIGVTTGAYSREALQKAYHTHLIEKLPELFSILAIDKASTAPI